MPGAFKVSLFNIKRDKSKPGAPYDQYFKNVIAPAMLDSGATPKQINTIISEFFFPIKYPPTHTHLICFFSGLLELKDSEPFASDSDLAGVAQQRGYAGVLCEDYNWPRVAMADKRSRGSTRPK
jgi:hypothetical protein